ncbi:MAG: alpha/beta fold hydrolase [Betaproteobacteria bacterium]|nr:alpha/beta fold hydrolase [Betaproteobacteria bacterium]
MKFEPQMESFRAGDGLTLRYVVDDYTDPWRPPQTLFLLHAAMGSSRRLYRWVPILARHFRVVRPDMRGHGRSDVPREGQLSFGRLVRDVVELADHLGCRQFHIAGSSAGAIISMQVALDHPQRVKTLAGFASPPGLKRTMIDPGKWISAIKQKGLRAFLEETIDERFPPGTDPDFVRWFVDEASRTNEEFLCRFVPVMREVDQTARLHEIECPMLAVVPDRNPHITLAQYEVIREHAPRCEFIVYHGFQHNITDVVPERCAGELKRFLLDHCG